MSDAPAATTQALAQQLEHMRALVRQTCPFLQTDPPQPVEVLSVSGSNFSSLQPPTFENNPSLVGYSLFGPLRNFILMRRDAINEIYPFAFVNHNYLRLLSAQHPAMPVWLDEGLAEFFETAQWKGDTAVLGAVTPLAQARLRTGKPLPLATLWQADASSAYATEQDQASMFYPQAWALTDYLILRDQSHGTHALPDFIAKLVAGTDPAAALTAFGDRSALEQNMQAFLHEPRFPTMQVAMAPATDGADLAATQLSPAEVATVRADFLAHFQRFDDAAAQLAQVRTPTAAAEGIYGFIAERNGHWPEAQKDLGLAESQGADDPWTQFHFADLSLRVDSGRFDPATAAHLALDLQAVIQRAPGFAPGLDRLATLDLRQNTQLDQALGLELQASRLDRANFGFRLNVATILLALKRPADAVAWLVQLQSFAATPADEQVRQQRLEQAKQFLATANAPPQPAAAPLPPGATSSQGLIQGARCGGTNSPDTPPSPFNLAVTLLVRGQALVLRSPDYRKVAFSAANFDPPPQFNPCRDMKGMQAKVTLRGGDLLSVELRR